MLRLLKSNMLLAICAIGIFQAVLVNIVKINIPVLTLFTAFYITLAYFGQPKNQLHLIKFNVSFYLLLVSLVALYVLAIAHSLENKGQIAFHLNVIISLIFGKTISRDPHVKFEIPVKFLWYYMVFSLLIYFFAWEPIAGLIYEGDDNLGLKTNGLRRLYGFLFNPLANAYFLLIMFYFTYALKENKLGMFKLALLFSMLLALTRGAMVSVALFGALYLVYRQKWRIILACLVALIMAYFILEPVAIIIDSIIFLEDTQGSVQGHEQSLRDAITTLVENPFGLGFADIHTESWVFNYGLYYGFAGVIALVLFFFYISFKLLLKRKLFYCMLFVSFIPVTLIIPFHTFNLPILLFFVFTYYLYYRRPLDESRI